MKHSQDSNSCRWDYFYLRLYLKYHVAFLMWILGFHINDVCCVQFLESMQLNYNSQAAEKGVYVIGSCGFDSIPADMGVLYTRDQFKGMKTRVHSGIDNETPSDPLSQVDVAYSVLLAVKESVSFVICLSAGILTAVESFLTVKSGSDVSNCCQDNGINLILQFCSLIFRIYVSLHSLMKWGKFINHSFTQDFWDYVSFHLHC